MPKFRRPQTKSGDPANYTIVSAYNQLDSRARHENDRDKSFPSPDGEARWGLVTAMRCNAPYRLQQKTADLLMHCKDL